MSPPRSSRRAHIVTRLGIHKFRLFKILKKITYSLIIKKRVYGGYASILQSRQTVFLSDQEPSANPFYGDLTHTAEVTGVVG